MQIYFLFVLIAAIARLPLPAVLSRINSPSIEYVFIKYSRRAIGFCVGCLTDLEVSPHRQPLWLLIFCIVNGYL